MQLLQPLNGPMPQDQQQYDELVHRIRKMGHILERSPPNIMQGLHNERKRFWLTSNLDGNAAEYNQQVYLGLGRHGAAQHGYVQGAAVASCFGAQSWLSWSDPAYVYQTATEELSAFDSGTDADTESSVGGEYDPQEIPNLSQNEAKQELYWQLAQVNGKWRLFTRKPVRKVYRFFRKHLGHKGKGKGKGKGKHLTGSGNSLFCQSLNHDDFEGQRKRKGSW